MINATTFCRVAHLEKKETDLRVFKITWMNIVPSWIRVSMISHEENLYNEQKKNFVQKL